MGTSARTPIVPPTGTQNVNCATQQPCWCPFPERSGTRAAAPVGVIDPFTAGSPSWPQDHRSQATSSVRFASKPVHSPKQSRSNVPLSSGGTPLCRDSDTQTLHRDFLYSLFSTASDSRGLTSLPRSSAYLCRQARDRIARTGEND